MSLTKLTQQYISEHPSIKDCLRAGRINYSALAREICDVHGLKQFDAVLIACRRYAAKVQGQETHEKRIRTLIRAAKLRMVNKILVAIIEKPKDAERLLALQNKERRLGNEFQIIEGNDVFVIVANDRVESRIREESRGRIKKVTSQLALITMQFDERLESTHGVVAAVYGIMAEHGINVLEEMSCWTDLMMVVKEDDAARVMRLLR